MSSDRAKDLYNYKPYNIEQWMNGLSDGFCSTAGEEINQPRGQSHQWEYRCLRVNRQVWQRKQRAKESHIPQIINKEHSRDHKGNSHTELWLAPRELSPDINFNKGSFDFTQSKLWCFCYPENRKEMSFRSWSEEISPDNSFYPVY